MLLIRLAVVFLVLYVIFLALRSALRSRTLRSGKANELAGEEMVLDPQCRSYLPKSEAFTQSGNYFCSRECAQKYLRGESA